MELTGRAEMDIICFMWRRIEEVITGLTRNQFAFRGTRVRIPPSPFRIPQFLGNLLFYTDNFQMKILRGRRRVILCYGM